MVKSLLIFKCSNAEHTGLFRSIGQTGMAVFVARAENLPKAGLTMELITATDLIWMLFLMRANMQLKSLLITAVLMADAGLAGCSAMQPGMGNSDYPAIVDAGYTIPGIPRERIRPEYQRQIVSYSGEEQPGTIIVDTSARFLYFVMPDGKAMRYGIGVGRDGFRWSGSAYVGRKAEWPNWTPPAEMIARQPQLAQYAGGMEPGLDNPLGARALYLYQNGRDTLYRLHGTSEWWTIGSNVSSGCIRLMNYDIIDLYDRAKEGAKVVVL